MFSNHPAADALKSMGVFNPPPTRAQLDSAEAAKQAVLDATNDAAGSYAASGIRDDAVSALMVWAGTPTSDLDEGETLADRLIAMAVGIADENKDGDLTDEESDVVGIALNAMADYLSSAGATDEDIAALLEAGDAGAAERVHELLAGSETEDAALDSFVFDSESSEAVMDSVLDAVYKKKVVVRKGKKVRINKRVSGTVRLSAAQKVAIRKAVMKSRSSAARMRRMKSMKVRRRAGL